MTNKAILSLLIGILISTGASNAWGTGTPGAERKGIDLSEPPFWMASFEELKDLRFDQKRFYALKVQENLSKISALSGLAKEDWGQAQKKTESWEKIMTKVYEYCLDPSKMKACQELANVRIKTLELKNK